MKDSFYHSLLRIASLTVAIVLLFESGLVNPITKDISFGAYDYLTASVGVGASIEPTELNQMTAKLAMMEKDLNEREASLVAREIKVDLNKETGTSAQNSDTAVYILSVVLFILLVLIVLNYALDYMRRNPASKINHKQTA